MDFAARISVACWFLWWLWVTTRSVLPRVLFSMSHLQQTLPAFVAGVLKIQYILKDVINKQMVQAQAHAKK